MRYIDIHCHVLPGVDDGAKDERESMELLRLDKEEGAYAAIATPHYSMQFCNDDPEALRKLYGHLAGRIKEEAGGGFQLFLGQELFYGEDTLKWLRQGRLLTMAGSDYVLVEFLPSASYAEIYRAARELAGNYVMILAHAERYQALRKPGRAEELIEAGVRIQLNLRSIGAAWYRDTARWCRKMLLNGNVHFLGTDMHNVSERPPKAKEAMRWMERHLEEDYLAELCYVNAEKLLRNERI